jgi:hypothetical protein
MGQNDFVIANDTASAVRADLQDAFQALATNNSGNTAPNQTYANMWWYETDTNRLKIRNEANTAWINVAYVDQTSGAWRILNDTQVTNTSGVQTGLIGDQSTATWETGTGTTESLVSPAKVKAAIDANIPTGYTDADARDAQAGHSAGDVGSYAFLSRTNSSAGLETYNPGDTLAGASLKYSGSGASSSTSPSGTWRCMGFLSIAQSATGSTLWLRIS